MHVRGLLIIASVAHLVSHLLESVRAEALSTLPELIVIASRLGPGGGVPARLTAALLVAARVGLLMLIVGCIAVVTGDTIAFDLVELLTLISAI